LQLITWSDITLCGRRGQARFRFNYAFICQTTTYMTNSMYAIGSQR